MPKKSMHFSNLDKLFIATFFILFWIAMYALATSLAEEGTSETPYTLLSAIGGVLAASATVTAALFAYQALTTWKKEQAYKHNHEQVLELRKKSIELQYCINDIVILLNLSNKDLTTQKAIHKDLQKNLEQLSTKLTDSIRSHALALESWKQSNNEDAPIEELLPELDLELKKLTNHLSTIIRCIDGRKLYDHWDQETVEFLKEVFKCTPLSDGKSTTSKFYAQRIKPAFKYRDELRSIIEEETSKVISNARK